VLRATHIECESRLSLEMQSGDVVEIVGRVARCEVTPRNVGFALDLGPITVSDGLDAPLDDFAPYMPDDEPAP
jgi:hypothetical protein